MATPQGHLESFDAVRGGEASEAAFLFYLPDASSIVRTGPEGPLVPLRIRCLAWARLDERHAMLLADGRVLLDSAAAPTDAADPPVALPQLAIPRSITAPDGRPAILLFAPERGRTPEASTARLTRVTLSPLRTQRR